MVCQLVECPFFHKSRVASLLQGHFNTNIKIAIFKIQHESLLVVSPGSLHMNTSIENIVCVHRVY